MSFNFYSKIETVYCNHFVRFFGRTFRMKTGNAKIKQVMMVIPASSKLYRNYTQWRIPSDAKRRKTYMIVKCACKMWMFKDCHSPGEKYCQLKLLLLLLPRVIYFFSSWKWNFGETLATQFSRIKLHKVPRTLLPNCYVVFLFLISWQAARPRTGYVYIQIS